MTAAVSTAPAASRMDRLIADDWRVLPFRDLALPYKLAIAHYMAADGEAWSDVLPPWRGRHSSEEVRQVLLAHMPAFDAAYGDEAFGVVLLPSERMKEAILQDREIAGAHVDWASYHASYCEAPLPEHPTTNRWPVVLSDYEDEIMQDGWHRLHCYLKREDTTIPAFFYPREHHLRAPLNQSPG